MFVILIIRIRIMIIIIVIVIVVITKLLSLLLSRRLAGRLALGGAVALAARLPRAGRAGPSREPARDINVYA